MFESLIALGDVYREKRNFYFAEASYKHAQDMGENLSGNSFCTGKAIGRLALVDVERGKKREVEELFNKSLNLALKPVKHRQILMQELSCETMQNCLTKIIATTM